MAQAIHEPRPDMPVIVPRVPVQPVAPDEAPARRTLREQIARLESDLGALFCTTYPRTGFDWHVSSRGGPRVLSLGELAEIRDELAECLSHNQRLLGDRTYVEELNRRRIEEMLLEPERHKWVVIKNEDIGERGCKSWHVQPRFGVLGMLMNWWRVRISSGCPLAGGRGRKPRPLPIV
ncbi:MAG: hypothetical protein QOK25_2008 [Thermoleophilaceae bacterium]|jgi:hypothetical protein|nr:hypothetical protein [Thermoleophilaceae bacterium]